MKKEFLVERQGKTFVLYAGLLDLAHSQGLTSVQTSLLQIPSKDNNQVAIVQTTVTMGHGEAARSFTGIGDAAPDNVTPAMRNCLIRMAETRSKARALRDAVNVGVTAVEELADESAVDNSSDRGYSSRMGGQKQQRQVTRNERPEVKETTEGYKSITDTQVKALEKLCNMLNHDLTEEIKTRFAVEDVKKLDTSQAAALIREFSSLQHRRQPRSEN